ncbi:hypothetical protein J2Z69_001696 [Paenibacillus shirakamiensis]|uniref:Excalibur calcium-binding domain-containing protein n=1 Tax=Paenibacillus shirakamiensis TaxID=1265935 RepID=A0ABS4JHX3_9BACL|nr:excalibur calcium-binding domain-containing protein [Paenibacillus shirakamiensis]MBP2000665.1 hypothetical protein [Paenibacillus shirakamiensis]
MKKKLVFSILSTVVVSTFAVGAFTTEVQAKSKSLYFKNCTAAKNAGYFNILRGEPGYRATLDRDHDGVACEKR